MSETCKVVNKLPARYRYNLTVQSQNASVEIRQISCVEKKSIF